MKGSFFTGANMAEGTAKDGSNNKQTGVRRAEAFAKLIRGKGGKKIFWSIAIAVYVCNWVHSMEGSTTWAYSIWATSDFQQHSSGLASLNIATQIISAVSVPFLAKFADVFARSWTYLICLTAYTVGFILIAFAPTLAAYIVGSVLVAIGGAAITLLNSILCADLVPLQYRGLAQGILSTPYLATSWYTSEIASALGTTNDWRWGYGMYAIITPVIMGPALFVLIWYENKAKKAGLLARAVPPAANGTSSATTTVNKHGSEDGDDLTPQESKEAVHDLNKTEAQDHELEHDDEEPHHTIVEKLWKIWFEMDVFGLLLLGFGWALLLLPFSLSVNAENGYKNPSLIAMFVVGALCLIAYCAYEALWAKFPTAPVRLLKNRTFLSAVVIDFIYMVAGYMNLTYLSSYVYVVTDLNTVHWNYWNNVLTMGLCSFGVVAGLIMRYTHRYKFLQLTGLSIKIIGYGLLVDKGGVRSLARLTMAQLLTGMGGAFSVVGSQVASQGSVPHQDVALVIALLSLWTNIGASIGSAIASAVWTNAMPTNLRNFVPASVNDTEVMNMFASITVIKALPYEDPVREGAIRAYETTVYPLWAAALGLSFIALLAGCFQTNYYLGNQQNAFDNKDITGEDTVTPPHKPATPSNKWLRWARFWDL